MSKLIIHIDDGLPYSYETVLNRIASLMAGKTNDDSEDGLEYWTRQPFLQSWNDGLRLTVKRTKGGSITFTAGIHPAIFRRYVGDEVFEVYRRQLPILNEALDHKPSNIHRQNDDATSPDPSPFSAPQYLHPCFLDG